MSKTLSMTWLAVGGMLMAACSDPPPPATSHDAVVAANPTPPPAAPGALDKSAYDAEKGGSVGIDKRIVDMCKLPETHFDFDSARVGGKTQPTLQALADCFLTGPGKGKNLRIVGHADQRGETEYNFALGQRRAGTVSNYLSKAGVADGRLATSSRGELEATGTDSSGWARDRRVEILLAE